ncbi:MAG: threonine--tRNA ligase [Sandaracinaceae bacterium]|nr:threonine--tRNA ligase [Sandaracinaceae bacterium]
MSEEFTARNALEAQGKFNPSVVAAMVNGKLMDLLTPIPSDATVTAVRDDEPAALEVIRHSTAHVMADAVQKLFPGTQVTIGPAIEDGFYYDFSRPDGKQFTDEDLQKIEEKMLEIVASDQPFRREIKSRDEVRQLFESMGEKFKLEIIDKATGDLSLYRHGDWVDFCSGPHVPSTRFLRAVKLTHVAGAYWRGDERNPQLQRIYGTAFASPKALREHMAALEEAKKRDHRKLGKELDLIAFHPLAPASPFFLPRGTKVYNALVQYVRGLYDKVGYDEVITPQIFDTELFLTSGHLPGYEENMFLAATSETIEKGAAAIAKNPSNDPKVIEQHMRDHMRFGVKPMNCPGHALLFGMTRRSYRELPYRMADFGRLHRFERSGVVQGLTRVRTFAQDDAHIFCTLDQIKDEIAQFLDLVYDVYRDFGFSDVRVVVATRPEVRLGTDEMWDKSEGVLIDAVKAKGLPLNIAEGEGAFYGAKIEFHLKDALKRSWQLGTMQVDFTLPDRFDLNYVGEDNTEHRPVMLHRAILGSVERFYGVLLEHVGGSFPTWLAPEQVALLTVSEKFNDFALEAKAELEAHGIRVMTDLSGDKLGAKIRKARMLRVPYLGVIGQKEVETRGLSVRSRDEDKDLGFIPLADVISRVTAEALPLSQRKS